MDPFREVLADSETTLATARRLLAAYQSEPSPEHLSDLSNTMQELTETIHDLSQSIAAVQREPERFGVDAAEVGRRIEQVGHINAQVSEIQEELAQARASTRPDAQAWQAAAGDGAADPAADAETRGLIYAQALQEQDTVLDSVYDTVATLREQANVMSNELEDQAVMLDDFDRQVDTAGDRLRRGMKRVDWVLRNNRERLSSCCITLLIIALVILLVLVLIL